MKIKKVILLTLISAKFTLSISFDYKIRKNNNAVLNCEKRCKPMNDNKKRNNLPQLNFEDCIETCLKTIPMTDQERSHRLKKYNF